MNTCDLRLSPQFDALARVRGFTLIELMVTLAITAILLLMAMPLTGSYFENARVRKAAEAFATGLHQARNEAIRTNANVSMLLTTAAPVLPPNGNVNLAMPAQGAFTSPVSWVVFAQTPVPPVNPGDPPGVANNAINIRSAAEGNGALVQMKPVGVAPTLIPFNGLGVPVGLNAPVLYQFTGPRNATCAAQPNQSVTCMGVWLSAGGQARVCEVRNGAAGDLRAC
jgi:type IV fimbrial biogenesis protein FimT